MGGATREFFLEVLTDAIDILRSHSIDHLLIGSIALAAILGDEWDPKEDIDILVRKSQARMAMDQFGNKGYSKHIRDPEWIYKVARPNVTVDLIFRASEKIEIDDEMLRRRREASFEGIEVTVPCAEDLLVMKCLVDSVDSQGHWYDAARLSEQCEDWEYVQARGLQFGPARVLSALLYAHDRDVEVPASTTSRLFEAVRQLSGRGGDYVPAPGGRTTVDSSPQSSKEKAVADTIQDKLKSYLKDTHAMEQNVLRMLDSMIASTDDANIKADLEQHKTETERHVQLLKGRLDSYGEGDSSVIKDAPAVLGALMKGIADQIRSDKPGKNARDGYITEAMEIAAYELLGRLATKAGDQETAKVADQIKRDELAMREKIESTWDKVIDLTLEEEGVRA